MKQQRTALSKEKTRLTFAQPGPYESPFLMPFSGSPIPVTSSHSSHASFLHLPLLSVLPLPFMNSHFQGH